MSSLLEMPPADLALPGNGVHYIPQRRSQHPFIGAADDFMPGPCAAAEYFRRSAWAWCDGQLDVGLQYAAAAVGIKCEDKHESCDLTAYWQVALLIKARELELACRAFGAIRHGRAESESDRVTATSSIIHGDLLCAMGRVDEGLADVSAGLSVAERSGARSLLPVGYVVMALSALRRADMRSCLDFVEKLTGEALLGYFGQAAGAWVSAQAAEARGGVDSVASLVAGIVTKPAVLRQLLVSEPAAASWLVRVSGKLAAGELADAVVAAAATASANNSRFDVLRAAALHSAGLRESDAGKLQEAANLYPDGWCGASAREDVAGLLAARRSERADAIHTLESALTGYTAIGATRDASRVANKLRDFGVRRGVVRAAEREGDRLLGLTNTEFAVAELVSRGHTNNEVGKQLFISRHTVAFHLKKVYQKMSVTSRVELAASWNAMQ